MKIILDYEYFAPLVYYSTLSRFTHCIFERYEHYQKMSFRNRCVVAGAEGMVTLTIPLEGGRNQRTLMKDVRILNSENWQANHWKTLQSLYNKSPFFEHYAAELEELYQRRFSFLADWNNACFQWCCDKLSLNPLVAFTEEYVHLYPQEEFVDWRNMLKPSTINSRFPEPKKYTQVFEDRTGFVPNLSVLDYIFCTGGKVVNSE